MIKVMFIISTAPPSIGYDEEDDFVTHIEDLTTTVNKELVLDCEGNGYPPPKYSWFWNSRPLSPSLMSYHTEGSLLKIHRIRLENSGTFSCLLENPAGTAEKHFDVAVNGKDS